MLKKILTEINTKEQKTLMHMKLNLKVILLLQFIEEYYIKHKENMSDADTKSFYETLLALMYLCEQLGILTFDMPDNFAIHYNTSVEA